MEVRFFAGAAEAAGAEAKVSHVLRQRFTTLLTFIATDNRQRRLHEDRQLRQIHQTNYTDADYNIDHIGLNIRPPKSWTDG